MKNLIRVFLVLQFLYVNSVFAEEAWDFDQLMSALAEHPQFRVDFEEQRSSMFLSKPVRLLGTLVFVADVKMEKSVTSPYVETIKIDNEAVVIRRTNTIGKEDTTHVTRVSLKAHPSLAKAIKGVSNIFAGDSSLLNELYDWSISGTKENWKLLLEPREEKLAEFVASIEVSGKEGIITAMHSVEADGDESTMTFSNRTTDISD